jgi:sigma-E factor negative regulatory protein RseB
VSAFSSPVSRRRDGRSSLLLAAVLTVAMPGLLLAACSAPRASQAGQEETAATANSAGGTAGTGGTQAAPAARGQSSQRAVRLLTEAAEAAVLTSYQGEEIVSRGTGSQATVLVSEIWHVSGGQTVTQTLATGTSSPGQPYLSSDTDGQMPEGVLGVTAPLVKLLMQNYILAYAGSGSVYSRKAQVVEAWRGDGSLAARFWLDKATKLPLEREVFDPAANVIGEDMFVNVAFGARTSISAPAGGLAVPQGPWTDPLPPAQLLALRSRGWLVRPALPGGLSLFTGAQKTTSSGTVLDLSYSDGLSVISLFEQRGNLAARLAGWHQTTLDGHVIYVTEPDQRSLTWSSHGMVYTLITDAPAQTVAAVVGTLPHDAPPGFWKRMSRGLAKLASWANPFH